MNKSDWDLRPALGSDVWNLTLVVISAYISDGIAIPDTLLGSTCCDEEEHAR